MGGDDSGAMVLGRLAPAITAEDSYEMLLVVNRYRPMTPDIPSTVEAACAVPATRDLARPDRRTTSALTAKTAAGSTAYFP